MKSGEASIPLASITRMPSCDNSSPISAILPSRMAISTGVVVFSSQALRNNQLSCKGSPLQVSEASSVVIDIWRLKASQQDGNQWRLKSVLGSVEFDTAEYQLHPRPHSVWRGQWGGAGGDPILL